MGVRTDTYKFIQGLAPSTHMVMGQPERSRLSSCNHIATEVWTSCQVSSWALDVVVGVGRDSGGCSELM